MIRGGTNHTYSAILYIRNQCHVANGKRASTLPKLVCSISTFSEETNLMPHFFSEETNLMAHFVKEIDADI